jgi:hypothetical protein
VASSLVTQRIAAPELSPVLSPLHSTVLYRAYGQGETAARLTEVSFCLLVGWEYGPVLPRSDGERNSLTVPPTSRCRTILGLEERSAASDLRTPEEEPADVRTDIRPSLTPFWHALDIAYIEAGKTLQ